MKEREISKAVLKEAIRKQIRSQFLTEERDEMLVTIASRALQHAAGQESNIEIREIDGQEYITLDLSSMGDALEKLGYSLKKPYGALIGIYKNNG